jgi:hypothetical protein
MWECGVLGHDSNGNNWWNGLPSWMRFVAMIGVPSGIAIFLTVTIAQAQSTFQRDQTQLAQDLKADLTAHIAAAAGNQDRIIDKLDQLNRAMETQISLERALCMQGAKTDYERHECSK